MITLLFENAIGGHLMSVDIRPMKDSDVEICGRICFEAFHDISSRHNFPPDFPSAEFGIQFTQMLFANESVFSVVAEKDGLVVGSNHLWEYDAIRAVGPITVDPAAQAKGAGRMLMQAVMARGTGSPGVRLVQDSFNTASMSLYTSLGFDIREPLVLIEGTMSGQVPDDVVVRPLNQDDYPRCAELCRQVHGFDRANEMRNLPPGLTAFVAIRDGELVAYASAPHFWALNHAVAKTENDMHALLTGVGSVSGDKPLSLLLPVRQSNLFRWLLDQGMRVVKSMNLMSTGEYIEPRGCYLPSVGY
jgi:predicted N-acetyltransferase YhbS